MAPTKQQTTKSAEDEKLSTQQISSNTADNPPDQGTSSDQPSETPIKQTWKKQASWDDSLTHFKNTRNATLSFIGPDGKLCSFTNGIFATNDPATIKKLEQTQDFKFGFITEFIPEATEPLQWSKELTKKAK